MNELEKNIEKYLEGYNPVSIQVLESKKLLRRYDTKFIVPVEYLPDILLYLQNDFDILEIDNLRQFNYENRYYDTSEYKFFNQHHNGKVNRFKIRERLYVDSNKSFLEVKQKTSSFFTNKSRIDNIKQGNDFDSRSTEFIRNATGEQANELIQKLKVDYTRITLVNKTINEKITIDRNIFFKNTINSYDMKDTAIIEVKQMPRDNASPAMMYLNRVIANQNTGFSKYCMGLVLTDSLVKKNNFKKTLQYINKIHGR